MEKIETTLSDPITYFNRWLHQPLVVDDYSVAGIIAAIDAHPSSCDETRQNYVMHPDNCHDEPDRYIVYRENQDVFYCFVYAGDESKTTPPVYFASSLNLKTDYGVAPSQIIGGDHCLVAERFTDFLWHIWGQYICLRIEAGENLSSGVSGIGLKSGTHLETDFKNPLGIDFPAGQNCYFSEDVIYIPHWGAAFLNNAAKNSFFERYRPAITHEWAAT